jgi:hypothetical protein
MGTIASPFSCGQIHVVTAWGDNETSEDPLPKNPGSLTITDSDNEFRLGGDPDVRTYAYFTPDGMAWYLPDYDVYPVNPYIMNVTILSTFPDPLPERFIPALSEWGMVVAMLLLICMGMFFIRRRQKEV